MMIILPRNRREIGRRKARGQAVPSVNRVAENSRSGSKSRVPALKPGKRGEAVGFAGIIPERCESDCSVASRQASGGANHAARPDFRSADVAH
jgi:hypothetical protein